LQKAKKREKREACQTMIVVGKTRRRAEEPL